MMTIVRVGKKNSDECMEFEFDYGLSAFTFYSMAVDHYREDDICICMVEEEDDEESVHIRENEWLDKDPILQEILGSGKRADK